MNIATIFLDELESKLDKIQMYSLGSISSLWPVMDSDFEVTNQQFVENNQRESDDENQWDIVIWISANSRNSSNTLAHREPKKGSVIMAK